MRENARAARLLVYAGGKCERRALGGGIGPVTGGLAAGEAGVGDVSWAVASGKQRYARCTQVRSQVINRHYFPRIKKLKTHICDLGSAWGARTCTTGPQWPTSRRGAAHLARSAPTELRKT